MNLLEERIGTEIAIKNILFATDFSAVSEAALPYVTALSLRYGGAVHIVHALSAVPLVGVGAPDPSVMGAIYEGVHSVAQEKIQHLADRFRGFAHKTYLRHGEVLDVVTEIIREQEIDLLVLGTHGRTGLGRLVMGSVAEQLFRQTTCPVLTIGPGVPGIPKAIESRRDHHLPPTQIRFREILCATDLKNNAAMNVAYAVSLAREFHSQLTLLHVIEDFGGDLYEHPGSIEVALHELEDLVPDQEGLRHRPEFVAQYGTPAEVILQAALESAADLIVLGVRPGSHVSAATHLAGSTAHKVVVGANCPVLTVRN